MPNQSPTDPFELPISDLTGLSYYDPYYLPPLLPPLVPSAVFNSQVDLNYLKYLNNLVGTPPAASDSPCSQFDLTSYYMNMAHSQALASSLVATSPPAMEHSACPSSPAPTPVTLASDLSPKQTLKSDSPSDSPLLSSRVPAVSPSSVPSSSRASKRSHDDDDIEFNDEAPLNEDPAARKRRQNTIAARKSRLRKMVRMEELDRTVSNLEKDKIQLETRLAVLESEKQGAIQRADDAAARIRSLEAQLLEAYKSQRH